MKPELASVVAFYQAGKLCLGKVVSEENGRFGIISETGESLLFHASRLVLAGSVIYEGNQDQESLIDFRRDMESAMEMVSGWDFSFLADNPQPLSEIAAKLNVSTDYECFALYLYLKDHPGRFSHKKDMFRLKNAHEVEEYKALSLAEQQRQHYLGQIAAISEGIMPDKATLDSLYLELPEIIIEKKHKDIQKLLRGVYPDLGSEEAVIRLRVACGELRSNLDPVITASGLPDGFSPSVIEEPLLNVSLPKAPVTAFSIDDEDTKDYDDAISMVRTNDGWQLGIHVSCVAAMLSRDGRLLEQAFIRASSLYAPNAVIPLFPEHLSEHDFSLVAKSEKPVLSLYLQLDSKQNVLGSSFAAEMMVVERNLSYREVDKAIHTELFKQLWDMAKHLKQKRQSANNADKHRYYYFFKEVNKRVVIRCIDNDSPARQIVEELMIVYNTHMADYAVSNNCPMLFRNISQFASPGEEVPASQAYLSTSAGFHPGIGTAAYLHATSPIRRVTDLINQYQILALLGDKPALYSQHKLLEQIEHIERRLLLIREVSQRSQRYWFLKFLEQDWLNEPLDACLITENHGKLRLEIMPWHLQVVAECDSYPHTDCFKLVIYQIDWQEHCVRGYVL
jgi:exoribonuclease-2